MNKIAMYGPGNGHNIEKWLSFFNKQKNVKLTFIYYGDVSIFQNKYTCVNFVRIKSAANLCVSLRKENFSLLIIQGAYSIFQSVFLSLFIRKDKIILVAWGNGILNCFRKNYFVKKLATKSLFKLADRIAAPDQLMRDIIHYHPKCQGKKYDFLWGIAKEYHFKSNQGLTTFTTDFLADLGNKYIIFWPRSILRLSRFDIGIDAIAELRKKRPDIVEKIKFIIWTGNAVDEDYLLEIERKINSLGLNKVIEIIIHPYLPDSDIKQIWERVDLSINLIENDGFSTQIGEAFITSTPLIVNEIEAYSMVKQRYNLPLKFTLLNTKSVADNIEKSYEKDFYDKNELDILKLFSENELDNDINFYKLLSHYLD